MQCAATGLINVGAGGISTACCLSLNNLAAGCWLLILKVACLVATEILALVDIKSFRAAGLLLLGLMAYDVFWVFGSPKGEGQVKPQTLASQPAAASVTLLQGFVRNRPLVCSRTTGLHGGCALA